MPFGFLFVCFGLLLSEGISVNKKHILSAGTEMKPVPWLIKSRTPERTQQPELQIREILFPKSKEKSLLGGFDQLQRNNDWRLVEIILWISFGQLFLKGI